MKSLLEKIQQVSQKLKAIEKDMQVGKGSYAYKAVSDHSVVLKVKEAEAEAGIISVPIKQDLVSSEIVRTNKQSRDNGEAIEGILYVDVIKLTLRIYDLSDPTLFIDIESFGRGLDSGDKGFGKAATYARKYALLNAYKIATGEDPDADASEKTKVVTQDEKKVAVLDYLGKNAAYANQVCKHFGVETTANITEKDILQIYDSLTKKKLL